MASLELPGMSESRLSPQLLVGAASPLWAYFGAAAAGGVAYWWLTRWTQAANLEALFGAKVPPVLEAMVEPVVEAVEAAVEAASDEIKDLPDLPVGGESAPVSPFMEALAPPEPATAVGPEATADPAPRPRAPRKGLPTDGAEA